MRVLRNLPIAGKLALSVALTLALVGFTIVQTMSGLGRIAEAGDHVVVAASDESAARQAIGALLQMPTFNRDAQMAQTAEAVDQAVARANTAASEAVAHLRALSRADAAPDLRARLDEAADAVAAYRDAINTMGVIRRRLLATRDGDFLPNTDAFRSMVEQVGDAIWLEGMDTTTEADARAKLVELNEAVAELRVAVLRHLATGDERQRHAMQGAIARGQTALRPLVNERFSASFRDAVLAAQVGFMQLGADASELFGFGSQMASHQRAHTAPARAAAERLLADLVTAYVEQQRAARDASGAQNSEVRGLLLVVGIVIAAVLVASGLLTVLAIVTPLRRLTETIGRIAEGDTAVTVGFAGRRDEVGRIAAAVERLRAEAEQAFAKGQMLEQMPTAVMVCDPRDEFRITYMNAETRRVLGSIEHLLPAKVAELLGQSIDIFHRNPAHQRAILSDVSRLPHVARIRLGDERMELRINPIMDRTGGYAGAMLCWKLITAQARLADDFEASVGQVTHAVSRAAASMKQSSEVLTDVASDTGKRAASVVAATDQASANVQTVAASAEELAASVREISRQVAESAAIAAQAVEQARATDSTVTGLAEAASRIGDVVRLIGDIAGQTNLLALNATIEAARAGEAGKGFAVVASEVKNLANQTAKATDEIAGQIAAMQGATEGAVSAIRSIAETIARMNGIATSIAAAVEQQGAATAEIARSVQEAAAGTSDVAATIATVGQAIDQAGGEAVQVLEAANGLAAEATRLTAEVDRFLAQMRAA